MSVREITVTLDDVEYLLHILVVEMMMRHNELTSYDFGVVLMTKLMGVDEALEIEGIRIQWGSFRYSLYREIKRR